MKDDSTENNMIETVGFRLADWVEGEEENDLQYIKDSVPEPYIKLKGENRITLKPKAISEEWQ